MNFLLTCHYWCVVSNNFLCYSFITFLSTFGLSLANLLPVKIMVAKNIDLIDYVDGYRINYTVVLPM